MDRRLFLKSVAVAGAALAGGGVSLSARNSPAVNTAAIVAMFPHVQLPPGTFLIDPIPLVSGVRLFGSGMRRTTLVLAPRTITDDPAFGGALNIHGTREAPITDVMVANLTVDGNAPGLRLDGRTEALNIEAISFSFAQRCHMSCVRAVRAYSDGFDYDDSVSCSTQDCEAEDCGGFGIHNSLRSRGNLHTGARVSRCGFVHKRGGFDVHGTPGRAAREISFVACRAVDCYRGFLIGGDRNSLLGCHDEGSREEGLLMRGNDNRVTASSFSTATDRGARNVVAA